MDETKIYNKLLEHDDKFEQYGALLEDMDKKLASHDSKLDKLTGMVFDHGDRLEHIEARLEDMPTRAEMNEKLDKIIHIVERLDQERTVTSYRLDDHDARIGKLEQSVGTV